MAEKLRGEDEFLPRLVGHAADFSKDEDADKDEDKSGDDK